MSYAILRPVLPTLVLFTGLFLVGACAPAVPTDTPPSPTAISSPTPTFAEPSITEPPTEQPAPPPSSTPAAHPTPTKKAASGKRHSTGRSSGSSGTKGSSSGGSSSARPTAICRDGTYSYSQHRRGTCSHHHGVATWLKSVPA